MTLLEGTDLSVEYRAEGRVVRALSGACLTIATGEAVGVIGESGSGKSTLARALVGLEKMAEGRITFNGRTLSEAGRPRRADPDFARAVQFVFQDASGALNPRMRNWRIATEPAALLDKIIDQAVRRDLAARLFAQTQLPAGALDGYSHQLSGGQRQRLALCRALSVPTQLMILDEPTSALDVSVQAGILDQLLALNLSGMAILLISHDLAVIRHLCTRIIVMRQGLMLEDAPRDQLFAAPKHPYTCSLLKAAGFSVSSNPK
jgi:peptide/nickel transport system ATP-binding protein